MVTLHRDILNFLNQNASTPKGLLSELDFHRKCMGVWNACTVVFTKDYFGYFMGLLDWMSKVNVDREDILSLDTSERCPWSIGIFW